MANFLPLSLTLLLVITLTEAGVARLPFQNDAETQIVGGRPARQGETPYQLSIRLLDYHMCGSSLVEIDGIQVGITAGHCIYADLIDYLYVVAGDINLADETGIEQVVPVDHIIVHQNYIASKLHNDIALIFFKQEFQLNENVQTVPLPSQGQVTSEGNLTVSGWGDLEYQGKAPDELQVVKLPVVNDTACQKAYEDYSNNVIESMICAGVEAGDQSPCHGDSGGPAISDAGYLAGIVSWGKECGHPGYPGVFTKVSYFVDWIHDRVANYKNRSN